MHICIISYRNILGDGNWGGVHTHARDLTYLLLEKKHSITFITGVGDVFRKGLLSIIPLEDEYSETEYEEWLIKVEKICYSIHQKQTIDLIFTEGISSEGIVSFSQSYNIPIVAFIHLLNIHYFFNIFQEVDSVRSLLAYLVKGIPGFVYNMLNKEIPFFKRSRKIVTGSYAIAVDLCKYYHIPKGKIHIIHNWIDTNNMDFNLNDREEIRQFWKISSSAKVFLMVGNLWWPKGFHIALKAFEESLKRVKLESMFLILIGDGMNRSSIEKIVFKSKILKDRVQLTGNIPNAQLSKYYSAADVFILPSLMNEVLPYTLLEAMACRLPVISSDISASREILGQSTSLVRRGDTEGMTDAILEKVFSDPVLLKDEGERNRERIKRLFSKQIAAQKIDQLLKDLF